MTEPANLLANFKHASSSLVPKGEILFWLASIPHAPTTQIDESIALQIRDILDDPEFVPQDNKRALKDAIRSTISRNRPETLRRLLTSSKIADPDGWMFTDSSNSQSLLSLCCGYHTHSGHPRELAVLLEENVRTDALGYREKPILYQALYRFRVVDSAQDQYGLRGEVLRIGHMLLDAKADPTIKCDGCTGLDLALASGDFELIAKARRVAIELHPGMGLKALPSRLQPAA